MTVLLGCPPGIKIVFDPDASVNAKKKNQFCNAKDGIACCLFEHSTLINLFLRDLKQLF